MNGPRQRRATGDGRPHFMSRAMHAEPVAQRLAKGSGLAEAERWAQ